MVVFNTANKYIMLFQVLYIVEWLQSFLLIVHISKRLDFQRWLSNRPVPVNQTQLFTYPIDVSSFNIFYNGCSECVNSQSFYLSNLNASLSISSSHRDHDNPSRIYWIEILLFQNTNNYYQYNPWSWQSFKYY